MAKRSAISRFEEKYIPEPNTGCWIWLSNFYPQGYGMFWLGYPMRAHRVSWAFYKNNGTLPPSELVVRHSCDNRWCVNPEHLSIGTHKDNVADAMKKNKMRQQNIKGVRHHMARLTEEDVLAIRAAPGLHAKIAAQYDISAGTVWEIKNRRTWGHI